MTKEEQLKKQKSLAQQMIDIIDGNQLPIWKNERLKQLNLKLDSLNRAGYYSRKELPDDEK